MTIPKINSAHGTDTRNILNRAIDLINAQGKSIQDLVAEGQLTPTQYALLIQAVNGLISKGDVSVYDIDKNLGKLDSTYFSSDFINDLKNGEIDVTNVLDGSITSPKLSSKSVSIDKTDFIETSTNLANTVDMYDKSTIDLETGEVRATSSDSKASQPFSIKPNTSYTIYQSSRRAYYDSGDKFISGTSGNGTFTTPANARIMRITTVVPNGVQLNEGDTLLSYEPYKQPTLSEEIKVDVKIEEGAVTGREVASKTLSAMHVDFIETSNNMINYDSATEGILNNDSGGHQDNAAHRYTDLIKVSPGLTYSYTGVTRFYLFDVSQKYIGTIYGYEGENIHKTVVFDEDVAYISVLVNRIQFDFAQMNVGQMLLPYEKGYKPKLDPNINIGVNKSDVIKRKDQDKFIIDGSLEMEYTARDMEAKTNDSESPITSIRTHEWYALYDDLVTRFPEYVSRTFLGNEDTGLPLYRYDFKPNIPGDDTVETKFPKVIIVSGEHYERVASWTLFASMREMCENWQNDAHIETLRWNAHFIVIPMVNPYGNIQGTRKNSNGVDILRNFPVDWYAYQDPTASNYGGPKPLSEPEAQYVYDVINENKDALYLVDFHNFSTSETTNNSLFLWVTAYSKYGVNVGKTLVGKMSRKWMKERNIFPNGSTEMLGYADHLTGGTPAALLESFGGRGAVFEVGSSFYPEGTYVSGSSLHLTVSVEAFINYLIIMLKNTVEDKNNNVEWLQD